MEEKEDVEDDVQINDEDVQEKEVDSYVQRDKENYFYDEDQEYDSPVLRSNSSSTETDSPNDDPGDLGDVGGFSHINQNIQTRFGRKIKAANQYGYE